MEHRRTVRLIAVVVDTDGLTQREHDKRVVWAEHNLQEALRGINQTASTIVLSDDKGVVTASATFGGPPEEERMKVAQNLLGSKEVRDAG